MITNYYSGARVEMLTYVPQGNILVLDIGCGEAKFGEMLKERNPNAVVWGVEPAVGPGEIASKRLDKVFHGLFDNDLNLPTNSFDAIFFNDSLEHFPDHVPPLRLAFALLKHGGQIIVSVPNVRQWSHLVHYLIDADWQYENEGIRDRTHLRFFTKNSIGRAVTGAGFVVTCLEGINPSWTGWKYKLLNLLALGKMNDMPYTQIAVVGKKMPLELLPAKA